ncbi:LacI family DNA-binding transcriptional regulator [Planomonospora sp. ID91781]|uniref:LacI family transcriptional regulator n=1 Tax=Planomonospora sphaerica TaxID=161355 RepID=A0A171CFH9_9ACTN|nr:MULTISPECIES: LacI family DNA-binding transcriptional regulator [Planomonospora]MBG0821786.1 LacI family DNA-binding transcriptional regulator [Planomonospora sp. ID91781]GAT66630.1 lacI family transcriptional regulator [Planomonospora sphaerica]
MGVSLRDVADLAGVSVKTVSNVVNGYAHVAPATRAKVEEALSRLDYRPNLSARNLRRGRTGVIALALPELDAPYFAELSRFVIDAAAEQRWLVVIEQTDGSLERERQILDGVRDHRVDGLILSPIAIGADELAARTDETALVLLGERIHDGPADHVAIDNVRAARDVTEHLIGLGRTRVAALGAQDSAVSGTAPLRLAGYREALAAHGLGETVVRVERYRRADGAAAMAGLLAGGDRPDAVFCFNDLLALGALRAILSRGLRVPEDIALAGLDDIEDGRYSTPTLTTVAPDKAELARIAVDLLRRRIDGRSGHAPQEVRAGYRLMARESTLGR